MWRLTASKLLSISWPVRAQYSMFLKHVQNDVVSCENACDKKISLHFLTTWHFCVKQLWTVMAVMQCSSVHTYGKLVD